MFQTRRADIERFARDLETRGRARASITRPAMHRRRFYRYAVEEELLDHSPAAHVRRTRLDSGWSEPGSNARWSLPRCISLGGSISLRLPAAGW
jgi:hypothetical protein